jgi:hypothetical protein
LAVSDTSVPPPLRHGLRRITAGEVKRRFPAARALSRGINTRFAEIAGHRIDGRRLLDTLLALGGTDPDRFLEWLDREAGYDILGTSGSYAHFPGFARRFRAFARANAAQKAASA